MPAHPPNPVPQFRGPPGPQYQQIPQRVGPPGQLDHQALLAHFQALAQGMLSPQIAGVVQNEIAIMHQQAQNRQFPPVPPNPAVPQGFQPNIIPPFPQLHGAGIQLPHPNFQQLVAEGQQARAAAGQHGLPGATPVLRPGSAPNLTPRHPPSPTDPHPANSSMAPRPDAEFQIPMPEIATTTTTEGQNANGGSWRITVNESTTTTRNAPHPSTFPPRLTSFAGGTAHIPLLSAPTLSSSLSPRPYDPRAASVYLLSSPNGPVGLVMDQQSLYTYGSLPRAPAQRPSSGPGSVRAREQLRAEITARQAANQPRPAAQANPARNLAALLLPLGGNIWLLVRLLGFIWFFTSANGWSRTLLMGLAVMLVFAAQTGILAALQESLWGPVRRHLEGVLPLTDNRPPPGAAARPPANTDAGRDGAQLPPDPAEAATRLVQQRQQQNAGWVMQRIRALERASLMFLASLVPGIWERHRAARAQAEANILRELAETARRAEQAEREGREEGEIDENGNEYLTGEVNTPAVGADGGAGAVAPDSSQGPPDAQQQQQQAAVTA